MFLKKPFILGGVELPSNIFYAPLAGCSDYPFRKMSAKFKPGLMFCEMVKMDALVRNDSGTFHILDYSKDMHPIGGQICGSKPEIAGQSARIIEDLGFDTVDLNCGCPVDKVTKDGSGSGMLKNPNRIGDVISNMVASVKIPVTVKIRAGWDENSINAVEITKLAEKAGAKAICIHGRTRSQAYKGPANWDHIKACKESARDILVIGNGDLFCAEDVKRMFEYTGCDAALIARGTMGSPWIAQDVYDLLEARPLKERTFKENFEVLVEHFEEMKKYHSDRRVIVDMRRVGCWFIKKSFGAREFREILSHAKTLDEIEVCLKQVRHKMEDPNYLTDMQNHLEATEEECCPL